MDEIQTLFTSALSTDSSSLKSEFGGLYKNWGRPGSQEERRQSLLESQKSHRNDLLDNHRGIVALIDAVEHETEARGNSKVHYRPTIYVAGFNKASSLYKDVLMLSEWLVDVPMDFEDNWYLVPCPRAVRVLLVAYKGATKIYSKYGQFMFKINTALPGGNPFDVKRVKQLCVLDCFWQEKNNTLYVLDLITWNNQQMTNCEFEFRNYWLTQQFNEFPDCKVTSSKNQVVFTLLPKVSCRKQSLSDFMMKYPAFESNFPLLDGLLFYHKKGHYVGGKTPLVGWLYPYMVPEILGNDIIVHESYMETMPIDYIDQKDFIIKFEENNIKKKKRFHKKFTESGSENMDVATAETAEGELKSPVDPGVDGISGMEQNLQAPAINVCKNTAPIGPDMPKTTYDGEDIETGDNDFCLSSLLPRGLREEL